MKVLSNQIPFKILSIIKNHIISYRNYALIKRRTKETNSKFSQYIILRANKDDFPAILKVMHETFYNQEPTCFSIATKQNYQTEKSLIFVDSQLQKPNQCIGLKHNSIMDETVLQKMAEGITVVARCKNNGCVVGAAINESTNPWDPDLKEKLACSVQCPKMKHYLLFQAHVQRSPKLWDCFHVQKIFEISNIFAKGEMKDPQLMTKLIQESRSLAADCGYKVVRVNASTPTIASICESLNMKLTAEIPFCSYLGKNLEPIFNPPHPFESVKIYVDESPQKHLIQTKRKK
ncbi:uncharacterized protein LOC130443343 [Diorhabda sublineata]|uniref:uncharacterized protein LOC130443343 n=1 Tax=Diorhabda sublineata TaxID=1163346 RepID=UPI0024E0E7F6|nr:uncharacterized protein LOC130443343 [Diorhabda sublineata]